jgi:hypothetical protein
MYRTVGRHNYRRSFGSFTVGSAFGMMQLEDTRSLTQVVFLIVDDS